MEPKLGTVRIARNVLATTARSTALSVPGVAGMAEAPHLLVMKWVQDGVQVLVDHDQVLLDLYLLVEPECNMLTVSRQVQKEVARAIQDIVGMPTKEINIHIMDIA